MLCTQENMFYFLLISLWRDRHLKSKVTHFTCWFKYYWIYFWLGVKTEFGSGCMKLLNNVATYPFDLCSSPLTLLSFTTCLSTLHTLSSYQYCLKVPFPFLVLLTVVEKKNILCSTLFSFALSSLADWHYSNVDFMKTTFSISLSRLVWIYE